MNGAGLGANQGNIGNVNGYQIREALKRWNNARNLANQQFSSSVYVFANDEKLSLTEVARQYQEADENYARLQELQQWYNSRVTCEYRDMNGQRRNSTLALAVKLVGGAGRLEKIWRESCTEKTDRYSYRGDLQRDKNTEYAQRSISVRDAMAQSEIASRYAMTLRQAIARANTTNVGLDTTGCPISDLNESQLTRLLG